MVEGRPLRREEGALVASAPGEESVAPREIAGDARPLLGGAGELLELHVPERVRRDAPRAWRRRAARGRAPC